MLGFVELSHILSTIYSAVHRFHPQVIEIVDNIAKSVEFRGFVCYD
jgi:hypothetical protein